MMIKSKTKQMLSRSTRLLMSLHGTVQHRPTPTQPIPTHVVQLVVPLSHSSMTGMAMELRTGTMLMTITMESSTHSTSILIVTWITMQTSTRSTAHSTVTMARTQSIQISTGTALKTTLTGMTTTTESQTSMTLMTETVVWSIMIQAMLSLAHITQLTTVATSMEAKTAPPTRTPQTTIGTSSSGTTHSPMSCSTTTDTTQQLHQQRREPFQNFTGSCLLDGRPTTVETIGILMPMEIHSPMALIPIKMPTAYPIGGIKTKVTMD